MLYSLGDLDLIKAPGSSLISKANWSSFTRELEKQVPPRKLSKKKDEEEAAIRNNITV
jgi:hypothetical protein